MKTVLESLQSFLGLSSEDRKPSDRQSPYAATDANASFGGYGFPLLIRRSKPKKGVHEEKQLPQHSGESRSISRRRVHSSHDNSVRIESLSLCDQSVAGLTNCLVNMYSRRIAVRKHADAPFDKCTSEYYSCAKKGLQNQRIACKHAGYRLDDANVVACAHSSSSSSSSSSDVSVSSCAAEDDVCAQEGAQQNTQYGGSLSKCAKQGCVEDVVHCKMSGLSIILAEKRIPSDDDNVVGEVQKSGASSENLHDKGENLGYPSKESSGECRMSLVSPARSMSTIRKKAFPPPLTTLAMQSYSDKRGQSPDAFAAGYCLRSFRRDGRFVLQEVRAPMPKYFRVLGEDGRLKLELHNVLGESSHEDDAASAAADVCVGGEVPILVTEVRYASNAHVEADAGTETLNIGMQIALCDELRSRGGQISNASTLKAKAGGAMLWERVGSAPFMNAEAAGMSNEVGGGEGPAEDGQRMQQQGRQGTLVTWAVEDMVNSQSSASTRCPEMRAPLYDRPSTSCIRRGWVHPISAF